MITSCHSLSRSGSLWIEKVVAPPHTVPGLPPHGMLHSPGSDAARSGRGRLGPQKQLTPVPRATKGYRSPLSETVSSCRQARRHWDSVKSLSSSFCVNLPPPSAASPAKQPTGWVGDEMRSYARSYRRSMLRMG